MDGLINVLKPPGMTSHDVVSFLRKTFKQKKIGHAGTLDPQAAGVLLVCMGQATRLLEYMSVYDKEYVCRLTLGITTTTQDAWGEVLQQQNADNITLEDVQQSINALTGDIVQTVPVYSAVKVNGVPLYKRARRGEEVQPVTRKVTIHEIRLLKFIPPVVVLSVRCSKGTYIRTLCHDIGEMLGTGAHMSFLLRKKVGAYDIDKSYTLEEITQRKEKVLLPVIDCIRGMNRIVLDGNALHALKNGQTVFLPLDELRKTIYDKYGEIAVLDSDGDLQAIAVFWRESDGKHFLKPKKVFNME